MKINKDNMIGAIVMLLIVGVVVWGVMITNKVNRIALAHDRLVAVLDPVIQQIQMARQLALQQQAQQARQEQAPVNSEKPSKGR